MNVFEIAGAVRTLDEVEKEHILATLELLDGNKKIAARALGINLKTLYNKLNRYAEQEANASCG